MSIIGSTSQSASSQVFVVTTPTIINHVTSATPTNETSVSFPSSLRRFEIENKGSVSVTLSFLMGQSGTIYKTLPPNAPYGEDLISASSITVYFQSTLASQRLEIIYWV